MWDYLSSQHFFLLEIILERTSSKRKSIFYLLLQSLALAYVCILYVLHKFISGSRGLHRNWKNVHVWKFFNILLTKYLLEYIIFILFFAWASIITFYELKILKKINLKTKTKSLFNFYLILKTYNWFAFGDANIGISLIIRSTDRSMG